MGENEPVTTPTKRSVSYTTLILAVVMTAVVTAGGVLAVVYLPGLGSEELLEQEGRFSRIGVGQEGQILFPYPYSFPPNVLLTYLDGRTISDTSVVEVTAVGFKWKHVTNSIYTGDVMWKAKGVKATLVPK